LSEILRTPEERFIDLPDFDWAPNYVEDLPGYEGLRMHLIDEGPPLADHIFLCLHGEPTWSFLYRKMIPVFLAAGGRVVAPDLFGFGRSDKPADESVYDFDFHRNALLALIQQRDLRRVTLVCQDWGGILGLTLPMEAPDRFERMIVMNTALATGEADLGEGFRAWRQFVRDNPDFPIAALMQRAVPELSAREAAAYEAPFPETRYRAGVRRFPDMVADHPDAGGAELARRAARWLASEWCGEAFVAVGAQDPVLGAAVMRQVQQMIRGASELQVFEDVGHFVQEAGDVVAAAALDYFDSLPPSYDAPQGPR